MTSKKISSVRPSRRLWAAIIGLGLAAAGGMLVPAARGAGMAGAGGPGMMSPPASAWEGATKPSDRRQPIVKTADTIWELKVKPGDTVTKGQLLVVLDQREELKNLDIITVEANSSAAEDSAAAIVEASKVELASKVVEYERTKEMYDKKVATFFEHERARLEVDQAKAQIKKAEADLQKARDERQEKILQLARQKEVLARMEIRSPMDGLIEDVMVREGEIIDPQNMQKPVLVVVQNDPLWVEVYVPIAAALKMNVGQEMNVRFTAGVEVGTRKAKVIHLLPVADAGAAMQLIRLEMPNPVDATIGKRLPAGMRIMLLPDNAPGVAAGN